MKRLSTSPGLTFVALLLVVGLLSIVAVSLPPESSLASTKGNGSRRVVVGSDGVPTDVPLGEDGVPVEGGPVDPANPNSPTGPTKTGGSPSRPDLKCEAGKNGGSTDIGVTATEIRLASTVVQSGVGASFLADSPKAMQAVVQKVNRGGGICGRTLKLEIKDDAWKAELGLGFIRNFIESKKYFALPVVPSSEGLTAAIEAKDISNGKIPVVGTDGMLRQQYQDDWVWPVATATESTMRIVAKHAYDKGARTFGIVYDDQYRFGKEGADAFKKFVQSLPGASVKAFEGILPGQSSYGSELQSFNAACNPCDMTAMLLEPATAETWVAGHPNRGRLVTSGAQTLFNRRFAQNCRAACQDMLVWTGYTPAIPALQSRPGIAEYVNDVKAVDPGIDYTNAFVQGAYIGMSTFVEAVRRVGPNLTRENLKAELDRMTYQNDMVSALTWAPKQHYANVRAQAFSLQYAGDGFSGFRDEQTGWIADPTRAK